MTTCRYCKMDSPDLFWKNTELNVNFPKKPKLFEIENGVEIPHVCKPKSNIETKVEKKLKCPRCDPQIAPFLTLKKLKEHLQVEHLDWWLDEG